MRLNAAVELSKVRKLSELEEQGLIQAFEFTHELAWKTMKDFLEHKGISDLIGSKDATRHAFKWGVIIDGEGWMDMIKSRNNTSHTYNQDLAEEIVEKVFSLYAILFNDFEHKMEGFRSDQQNLLSNLDMP